MSDRGVLSVDRKALLGFYDAPAPDERGIHAAAINAVAGEEFGLALLVRFLRSNQVDAVALEVPCTTGGRRGHRLDGWVRTPDVLYQVEVKNWSSNSLGGTRFPLDASQEESRVHRIKVWGEYWDGSTFVDPPAAKVLEPMRPPTNDLPVEPLIAFWVSLHPAGDAQPLFRVPLSNMAFEHVNVFSMSTYLRGLAEDRIDLALPKTTARLAILDRVFALPKP